MNRAGARQRFEQAFADWLGVGYAFAFWKGRVAWYAILRALGVGEGDEVVLPGYTCVMDVNPSSTWAPSPSTWTSTRPPTTLTRT